MFTSRPTSCTNSYNVSLYAGISWYHTCGCCHTTATRMVPAYTNSDIQFQNVAPDDGLKSPKHVERLMINKDTL